MAEFVDLQIETSASALADAAVAVIQATYPTWTPHAGNLEVVQIDAISRMAAEQALVASTVPAAIFRNYGTKLLGLPYENGVAATANVTFTLADTLGHTIPATTDLTINGLGFYVATDVVIAPGSNSGTGVAIAVEPGVAYNGAQSPAFAVDAFDWLQSVTATTPSSGGVDPETDDDYQNRLAGLLALQAPRPITAADYATFVLSFNPAAGSDQQEVGRATAIDGYDPNTTTFGNSRIVTVFVTDANGNALNADTLAAIDTWLQGYRELNFIVNVLSPTYTAVYVSFSLHPYPGFDASAVAASAQAAVVNYLSPAQWRLPPTGASAGWLNDTTVRVNKLIGVIENVTGVDYVVAGSLTLGTSPSPVSTADLVLTGPAPLPTSTTVTVPLPAVV